MSARVVHSEPVQSHVWMQIAQYEGVGSMLGAKYHWVADGPSMFWAVVELRNGVTINGWAPFGRADLNNVPFEARERLIAAGVRP